jgi:hypothetical protein
MNGKGAKRVIFNKMLGLLEMLIVHSANSIEMLPGPLLIFAAPLFRVKMSQAEFQT